MKIQMSNYTCILCILLYVYYIEWITNRRFTRRLKCSVKEGVGLCGIRQVRWTDSATPQGEKPLSLLVHLWDKPSPPSDVQSLANALTLYAWEMFEDGVICKYILQNILLKKEAVDWIGPRRFLGVFEILRFTRSARKPLGLPPSIGETIQLSNNKFPSNTFPKFEMWFQNSKFTVQQILIHLYIEIMIDYNKVVVNLKHLCFFL